MATRIEGNEALDSNAQWRFNNSGQLVNSDPASWDLATQIGQLNIQTADGEQGDPVQTPPNPKMPPPTALHLAEASPLDTSSSPSIDSSPHSDHQIAHSRDPSADSTASNSADKKFSSPIPGVNKSGSPAQNVNTSEMHRSQNSSVGSDRPAVPSQVSQEQPSYPSLSNANGRSPPQAKSQPRGPHGTQRRGGAPNGPGGFGSRQGNQYRQPPQPVQVGIPQQGLIPSPTTLGYNNLAGHLPSGTNRPQQNDAYRGIQQHSASESMRDAPSVNLVNGNMQAYNAPMFTPPLAGPPLAIYPNQYYPSQEAYRADLAAQTQAMLAARLQSQYGGQYPAATSPQVPIEQALSSPSSSIGGYSRNLSGGPSANNRKLGLYKTELCRSWEEKNSCRYGSKCQFAHGEDELKNVQRHPKYKTEICRTFWVSGSCPYGKRCCFIHTELPAGGPNAAQGPPPASTDTSSAPANDGRPRSLSNSSDPNDAPVSILARLSTKVSGQNSNGLPTPVDSATSSNFAFSRPPTGSLRVDTKSLDNQAYKTQNKTAYPVFTNGRVNTAQDGGATKSPVPVTAGPDFGRHNAARLEIVGNNNRSKSGTPTNAGGHSYTSSADENAFHASAASHQRSNSVTTWGNNLNRAGSNLANPASPANEITSPWTTQRLHQDKPWA